MTSKSFEPTPITRTYDDEERQSIHIGNADKTENSPTRPATATNVRPRTDELIVPRDHNHNHEGNV